MEKTIEIPFGAKDSELKGWEYTIPEDMEVEVKDGKIIVKEKESEDERVRKHIIDIIKDNAKSKSIPCDAEIDYLERQKEQNPAEWSEDTIRKAIEEVGLTQHQINWFKNNVFPPKQEWSEEDKVMLNNIIWSVHMKSIIKPLYEMDDRSRYKKYEDFLKALPERFNLQPRTEWSEEDEEMIARICANLEYLIKEAGCDSKLKEKLEERVKWMKRLKSLRPQPHQTVEDKSISEEILKYFNEKKDYRSRWYVWVKYASRNPRWKPSKEQMEALEDAFRKDGGNEYRKVINSLYCDLQKLL